LPGTTGADHPDPGGDVVPLTVPVQHLDGVKLHVIWQAAEQQEAQTPDVAA